VREQEGDHKDRPYGMIHMSLDNRRPIQSPGPGREPLLLRPLRFRHHAEARVALPRASSDHTPYPPDTFRCDPVTYEATGERK